jgi:hypothetical protein
MSRQFFALAKSGVEPFVVVFVCTVAVVRWVTAAGGDTLFLLPPPQPAATASRPAARSATATRVDLVVIVTAIVDLWRTAA